MCKIGILNINIECWEEEEKAVLVVLLFIS